MRWLTLCTLVAAVLLGTASLAGAQGKDKDKDKDKDKVKKPEWPTEIAGRSFEKWLDDIQQLENVKKKVPMDRAKSVLAMKTIVMFGPQKAIKAVPPILEELKKHKPAGPKVDASFRANAPAVLAMIMN